MIGSVSFQLVNAVKDEQLDINDLHYYGLSLLIEQERFQFCITDVRNNQCLMLEDYIIEGVASSFELKQVLTAIIEDHHLLMAGFWHSVKVSFNHDKFAFIPAPLFDEKALKDYLNVVCELEEDDEVLYYKQIHAKAVNVFAADRYIIRYLRNLYSNIQVEFLHHSSVLTEGVLAYESRHKRLQTIGVFVEAQKLHLIVGRNKHLEFYNQYHYNSPQKAVYYLLLAMKELELSPESSQVNLWGDIDFESPVFNEFYRYIRNISFGHRPNQLKFRYFFDELKDHQYFDVYNICLCE